ncbi:MAG: hypothetical protein M3Y51_03440 [Actinomycetota bacterium]|nr:hypothetical protein [Actinomycetota bacterium]
MNRMKKSVVAAGLTAGLLGGGVAGAILGSGGISGAQENTTTVPAEAAPRKGERPDRSARLKETLAPLVEDGTLTQAQADKVIETLLAARHDGGGHGGHGGRGGHGWGRGGFGGEAAAAALGISVDELRTALRDGRSIAEIAASKGVSIDTVIAAIVAERTATIEEKVASGHLTPEQADEKLARLTERVTEMVNATPRTRGERRGGAPGGTPDDAPVTPPTEPPAAAPADPPPTPTTTPPAAPTTDAPTTSTTAPPADAPADDREDEGSGG